MKQLNITIDGQNLTVPEGTTVLRAATENGIKIPNLCYDGRVELYGACGLCVVEIEGVPKLLRACSAKVTDGMVVHTNSERITRARKTALELLLSDHSGDCKAPCTLACPANTDCQGYVGLIANGEYKQAVRLIKDKIPLPAAIGRICPHPCEKKCRRQYVDEPISIAGLKAFAADMDMASEDAFVPDCEPDSGKSVAVVGGGPGGLTAAYFLRRAGHRVTVLDMMPKMGGMLRYGIPEYRLPKQLLDKEIQQIEQLGVTLKNNIKIGVDVTLDSLKSDYDAVVLAAGAWRSTKMRVPGEDLKNVFGGIDFLRAVALGDRPAIGERVAVVGGGNTAMDACRTAVRLGAKEVYVIYRRTRNEMPAEALEITEAQEEGVTFKFLCNPIEFVGENGHIAAVTLQKMQLGAPDASGRRRPEPIEGETETIALDSAIMAIGQQPSLEGFSKLEATKRNTIAADELTFRTSEEGVFAVGDMTNKGADIAIAAIGEAQKAAVIIDRYLNGEAAAYKKPFHVTRELAPEFFDKFPKMEREVPQVLSPKDRRQSFDEVSKGFTQAQAEKEAMRCLECGCHDFFECKLVAYANDYNVQPERFAGEKHQRNAEDVNALISRNTDKCILCGLCVRVCEETMGKTNLGLLGRGFDTLVQPEYSLPLEETGCMFCGQCVAVCPTGALRERQPLKKQLVVEETCTQSVCNLCSALCATEIHSVGSTVTRVKPDGEKGILCKAGKFSIFALNTDAVRNAEFSPEAQQDAQRILRACASEARAVVLGATSTVEEIQAAYALTQNVYAVMNEHAAAYRAFLKYKVRSVEAMGDEKVVLLLNSTYTLPKEKVIIAIDSFVNKQADVMLLCAPFTANSGTYLEEDGCKKLRAAVQSKLPTAYELLRGLTPEGEISAESVAIPENRAIIHSETVQEGGDYMLIQDNALIDAFQNGF